MAIKAFWMVATALSLVACEQGGASDAKSKAEAGAATASASAAAVRPDERQFRDWRAVCDNGNRCVAYTGSDAEGGWLMVRMDAGPDARPQILAGSSVFSESDALKGVRLDIDGRGLALADGAKETGAALPADQTTAALAALASARALTLTMGGERAALPTAGASAALLWIDERQGRLDTQTALIRRGDKPASTVPAPPALPQLQAAPAVDQGAFARAGDPLEEGDTAGVTLPAAVEALDRVKACRADTNEYLQKSILAARLAENVQLWGVPCSAGAYNATYELYLTDGQGRSPRLAKFPDWRNAPRAEGDIAGDGLVNPVFDARTNTIRHFPRGRGVGDCGVMQSWTWTGGAFELNSERTMGDCWGISGALWPTTWRTR